MNGYKQYDPIALVNQLERLNAELDEVLSALQMQQTATERATLMDALAQVLDARGIVLDAFLQWCSSPQGKRAAAGGRRWWQDTLERLRKSDQQRATTLGELVAAAGEHLRQRIAHQAVFIYQRGAQ